ncbi:transglutaminase family protein [Flavobacterium franklandianum]|uniref:Transglutaminase family protein n=1 Tax=Flavobacterium franklandianum TaxID=2594430 RepID=A0A553CTD6_9FLAO|nr:transglutaminase family protein [Flavobacterium franklandianum]TRX23779.1 transglutaminase family protein [Flavobacterium franklandianum]TRX24516.1 transglutaminase family protein [Flavobacterium franklandianum]
MATFKIVHITKYQYNWPIKESINEIRLFPHNFDNQEVLQHQLLITTNPNLEISKDFYGNSVGNFNILEPHKEMIIESQMLVRVNHSLRIPEIDTTKVQDLELEKGNNSSLLRLCSPEVITNQKKIDSYLKKINAANISVIEIAQKCSEYIFKNFTYTKGITNIETTVDEILVHKKGVCQDFAHVLLQFLRTAGIPSRYVSGYICPNSVGFRGEGATHAWVEFYTPSQGWLGIDPTNNVWTMDNHVKLSVGRDFNECSPVKGTFKGFAKQTLSVSVSIGYEDGRQFEEVNHVKLQKISDDVQRQLDLLEYQLQLQLRQQQQQQQ